MLPHNLFMWTVIYERTSALRSAGCRMTDIYMWEIRYVQDDKMKAVSRKGRCGMNLSWRSKWRERGGVGSRKIVESDLFFPPLSRGMQMSEEKEKDDGEIKVDTGGNFLGAERKRERKRERERYGISMRSAVLHSWLLTPFSLLIWTENFIEHRHFPWNFHNFCIIQKCTNKEQKKRSLSVFSHRRASACRKKRAKRKDCWGREIFQDVRESPCERIKMT